MICSVVLKSVMDSSWGVVDIRCVDGTSKSLLQFWGSRSDTMSRSFMESTQLIKAKKLGGFCVLS